jgi:ABC-type nitrate/sulfonate/bicarbonate transport system permease component
MAKGKQWQLLADTFWQKLQDLGNPEQAWQAVHDWWLQQGHSEQSWKSASGAAFERIAQRSYFCNV